MLGAAYKKKEKEMKRKGTGRKQRKRKEKRKEKKRRIKKKTEKPKDRKGKERKILKIGLKVPKLTEINLMILKSNRDFKNPLRFA